jgi:hypothetical protein
MLPPWIRGSDKVALDIYLTSFEQVCNQCGIEDDVLIATIFKSKADCELTSILQDRGPEENGSFEQIS